MDVKRAKRVAVAAGLALSGIGSVVSADQSVADLPDLSLSGPVYAQQQAAPTTPPPGAARQPLMALLDSVGLAQPLDAARINIFGHVEAGYTYNFMHPSKDLNLGRVFDAKDDRVTLNQVDLNIERTVDLTSHQFDVGGRVEVLYGGDARFIHSSGLLDSEDFFHGPEYQLDLPQLYVDVAVPLGNGIRVRLGKFLFFKQIDPNASVFYSHSYTFGAALPFTLTGVTALYNFSDQLSVEGGFSRGWGQTLRDNNGAIDALARVRYAANDRTAFTLAGIVGPELDRDNGHYRAALDLTVSQEVSDNLTLLLDAVYGYQAGAATTRESNWYGVAGYAIVKLDPRFSVAGRLEWYRDEEGFTTGVTQNLYEATLGLQFTPFPNDTVGSQFKVRPEVRYDYSSRSFFDGLSRHDQATFAVDAIFNF